jgi:hypothetical protein
LRYDYLPGASAFLVWTREQTDSRNHFGNIGPGETVPNLLRTRPTDMLLFKLEHRYVP